MKLPFFQKLCDWYLDIIGYLIDGLDWLAERLWKHHSIVVGWHNSRSYFEFEDDEKETINKV